MGYQPLSSDLSNILGKERGRIFNELAITIWQVGRYPLSCFTSTVEQVSSLTITNDQGMEFSLAYEEDNK
jgi:hypothetical protein